MENIDDLMRQKFDSDEPEARFEFQEEYWEQAMALLEQDEARRRRKWWWLLLPLLLLLVIGSGIWLLGSPQKNTVQTANHPSTEQHSNISDQTQHNAKAYNQSNETAVENTKPESNSTQSANPENTNSSHAANNTNTAKGISPGQVKAPNLAPAKSGARGENNPNSLTANNLSNQSKKQNSGNKRPGAENKNKPSSQAGNGNSGSSATVGMQEPASGKPSDEARAAQKDMGQSAGNNGNALGENSKSGAQTPAEAGNQAAGNGAKDDNAAPDGNASAQAFAPTLLDLMVLPAKRSPIPMKEPTLPAGKPKTLAFQPSAKKPAPPQEKRISAGLSLAGAACKASDTLSGWAGITTGAWMEYRFNQKLSLSVGLQYRFTPGYGASDTAKPAFVEKLRYSFGYKSESWQRETRGLHQVEIPVALHYNWNRWTFGIGASAGKLLLVQNTNTHTQASSLEDTQKDVKKWVIGNKSLYRSLYFAGFADAAFAITPRWSLFTKGQYRLTPMFKTGISDTASNGLGYLDLGIRFRIY